MATIDRRRVTATGESIDRRRVTEKEPNPTATMAASGGAGQLFRQWSIPDAVAPADEGQGGEGQSGYYLRRAGDTRVKLRVDLDRAPTAAATLAFTVSGTAVAGTHYSMVTTSPVTIPEGQSYVDIELDPALTAKFFAERTIIVTLNQTGSTGLTVDSALAEFRLLLRPSVDPPSIVYATASQTGAPGAYSVNVTLSTASLEATVIYYLLSGQVATDGNYTITSGDESGALSIPAGSTSATLNFTITGTPASGDQLVFTFEHELNTVAYTQSGENVHADENSMHFSQAWDFEAGPFGVGKEWPGDPTLWGNAGLLKGSTKDEPGGETSLEVLAAGAVALTPALAPDGALMQAVVISDLLNTNAGVGYIRESFEDNTKCGGPLTLRPLKEWNRFAIRFAQPTGVDAWRRPRFFTATIRVRTVDIDHTVTIDTRYTGTGRNGVHIASWTMGSETWGVWEEKANISSAWTSYGALQQTFSSEGATKSSGSTVNTFWMVHRLGGTFNGKLEQPDIDLGVVIFRPTWASSSDGTGEEWRNPLQSIGYGNAPYWPWWESSATALSGAPTKYWHKKARWWEPRGLASIGAAGQNTHTYTR